MAGYYNANGRLYRFAAAELAPTRVPQEKGVSLVLAGGLIGAVIGPNLAAAPAASSVPFAGAYLALAVVACWHGDLA
jgi:hypothetical protein